MIICERSGSFDEYLLFLLVPLHSSLSLSLSLVHRSLNSCLSCYLLFCLLRLNGETEYTTKKVPSSKVASVTGRIYTWWKTTIQIYTHTHIPISRNVRTNSTTINAMRKNRTNNNNNPHTLQRLEK